MSASRTVQLAARILADSVDNGSGFAISPRVAFTAAHVVRDRRNLSFSLEGAEPIPIEECREIPGLDVAILSLSRGVLEAPSVRGAVLGERWHVTSRQRPNDPWLTGTVEVERRPGESDGHAVSFLQLHANQSLLDFHGYSGSPVITESDEVIGILVEQVNTRLRKGENVASNDLYAVPILDALERSGLQARSVHARPISSLAERLVVGTAPPSSIVTTAPWEQLTAPYVHAPGKNVREFAFSPDGARLATAGTDNSIKLFDLPSDSEICQLHLDTEPAELAFSRDGTMIAARGGGTSVHVWRIAQRPKLIWSKTDVIGKVSSFSLSPSGKRIAVAIPLGESRVWPLSGRGFDLLEQVDHLFHVSYDPYGNFLAVADVNGKVTWWPLTENGFGRIQQYQDGKKVSRILFEPRGRWLVSVVNENARSTDQAQTAWVRDVRLGKRLGCIRHAGEITSVAVSTHGSLLATGCASDKTVRLWEIESESEPVVLTFDDFVGAVALSPDGRFLAVSFFQDLQVLVFDLQERAAPTHLIHDARVQTMGFSSTGLLGTATTDRVLIWRRATA